MVQSRSRAASNAVPIQVLRAPPDHETSFCRPSVAMLPEKVVSRSDPCILALEMLSEFVLVTNPSVARRPLSAQRRKVRVESNVES